MQVNASLTGTKLALRSAVYYWRTTISLALAVATATAVITGALLVGDSMRGSLKGLTEQRLGEIDYVLTPGRFFHPSLWVPGKKPLGKTVPITLFSRAIVEFRPKSSNGQTRSLRRVGSAQVIASGPDFWNLEKNRSNHPSVFPDDQSVVLNQAAANALGVKVGDQVTVRLPKEQAVPAESPLGRRDVESEGLPHLRLVAIVPNAGLGRFSLMANQTEPLNVYLSAQGVAEILERPGQANTLLIAAEETSSDDPTEAATIAKSLQRRLSPKLADFGLRLERVRRTHSASQGLREHKTQTRTLSNQVIYDYYSLTSEQLLIPEKIVACLTSQFPAGRCQPVLTYLANAIERVDGDEQRLRSIPYSTITAIDPADTFPLDFAPDDLRPLPNKSVPIVLNQWGADRLGVQKGDRLRVFYFEPETQFGHEVERSFEGILTQIVPLTKPIKPFGRRRPAIFENPPTVYNDPNLTPTVAGITDQRSISQWQTPFPLEREIGPEDETYWDEHRLTPKAFLPLTVGRKRFGNRFGKTTSLRMDSDLDSCDRLAKRIEGMLRPHAADFGYSLRPIRAIQVTASGGTTPFDLLFLSLSTFVIFSALLLIALVFRLGLAHRCDQFGILIASGWPNRQATKLARNEGMLSAIPGILLGTLLGVCYAKSLLWGLKTYWVDAITVPFLKFHWSLWSLILGGTLGAVVAWIAIRVTVRHLVRSEVIHLLAANWTALDRTHRRVKNRWGWVGASACLIMGLILQGFATGRSGQIQAGLFATSGMFLLIGVLLAIYMYLVSTGGNRKKLLQRQTQLSLTSLAFKGVQRNPLRSVLMVGLMASASFLILVMGLFRQTPTSQGTGGFDLIGETTQPIVRDLNEPKFRSDLFMTDANSVSDCEIISFRLRTGQDASCNNLYQTQQPPILGAPTGFGESGDTQFAWAAVNETSSKTPWSALASPGSGTITDPTPVILDQNTALWSLHMSGGIGQIKGFRFDDGRERFFQVVGLLSNSILQGKMLIGEANFKKMFPHISGSQYFLIRTQGTSTKNVSRIFENRLSDLGMDITETGDVLARLLNVQNTYLRTFQILGALGLALGTIGLAIAQMRTVLERRRELAIMQAVGFQPARIASLVLIEHIGLLGTGIGCGALAAMGAVVPHALLGQTRLSLIEPSLWVIVVLLIGLLTGLMTVNRIVRLPLLESLRAN